MVTEKKPQRQIPFEEVESKIRQRLLNQQREQMYQTWLKEKQRQAKILRNHKLIASLGDIVAQEGTV